MLPTSVTVFHMTVREMEHILYLRKFKVSSSNLKLGAASVSEILVSIYQTIRDHIAEDNQTNIYC
jgi:hypothetical protein